MKAMRGNDVLYQSVLILFISIMCVLMIYPFLHVFTVSLSTPAEAVKPGLKLFPKEITLLGYQTAFKSYGLWMGFANSGFRTIVGTFASLVVMMLVAYPLSKKELPLRTLYTMFIVITMFFSGGLIPTYLLVKSLGLYDSRLVYILGPLFNTFSLLILRNFLAAIPRELEDSAKMDGAHELRILYSIITPLCKPVLATLGLWSAVHHWNAWFDALIYIADDRKMVVQVILRRLIVDKSDVFLQGMDDIRQNMVRPVTVKSAILMITTAPILVLYPFLQKYFVKGIMVGSLKG